MNNLSIYKTQKNKLMSIKTVRNFFLFATFTVIVFGVGFRFGESAPPVSSNFTTQSEVKNTRVPADKNVDFSLFWEVWRELENKYVDQKAIDTVKMVNGAISGMVSSLGDPYTVFLPPTENKDAKDDLGGRFEGIGAQLGVTDKKIVVVAPLKGTPAEAAGLKPGDWIIKIDSKDTYNMTLPEAVTKIRGTRGTKVTLNILQKNQDKPKDFTIIRDTIKVASVEWELKSSGSKKVAILRLTRFGDNTNNEWDKAVGEIKSALEKDSSIKGLVLDLRNNPGGYLSGAVNIGSEFLGEGVVVLQENAGGYRQTYNVNRTGRLISGPLVVLINKGSASASEIVAGALQDRGRAKLVGDGSYGKGTIQDAEDLPGGAGLHVTIAKWLTPKGTWIHGKGLTPDVKVENDDKKPDEDLQQNKAIELLTK